MSVPLYLEARLVIVRQPDNDGQDGGGAPAGSPEQDVLREGLDYQPPIYLRMIRVGLLAVTLLLVFLVLFSVYWFVVAANLKGGLKTWVGDQMGAGIRAQYEGVEISGYPFFFRVILTKPQVSLSFVPASSDGEEWRWQASRIIAVMKPWDLNTVKLDLSGSHDVEITRGAVRDIYRAAARQSVIAVIIGNDGLPNISTVTVGDLEVWDKQRNEQVSARHVRLQGSRLFPQELTNETPTFDVSAAIQGFYLPKRFSLPLGHKIERFRIKLQVLGQLKRPIDRETLTAWRDDGGTIEISALEARYGSLQMVASGTMALDHQLQPLAAMSVKLQGYVTALDQLRAARVIGAREVAIAKLVLGALSRRELDGGPAAVRLPFNIRNGFLTAQGIKLFAIPPVVWPGKAAKVQ